MLAPGIISRADINKSFFVSFVSLWFMEIFAAWRLCLGGSIISVISVSSVADRFVILVAATLRWATNRKNLRAVQRFLAIITRYVI